MTRFWRVARTGLSGHLDFLPSRLSLAPTGLSAVDHRGILILFLWAAAAVTRTLDTQQEKGSRPPLEAGESPESPKGGP